MQFTGFGNSILDGEQFFQETLYQCSHWRASAYVEGPNLLTWEDIYHLRLMIDGKEIYSWTQS
jgi:hypothetical protein